MTAAPAWAAWVAGAFGLVAGSFVGLCVWRLPRGLSVVRPGSRCPGCGHALSAWENLPVLGFVWLRGRCRACRGGIGWRYPLVELGCGAAFWWSWRQAGGAGGAEFVRGAFFLACLIALAASDWETRLLPDEITLGGAVTGLVLAYWTGPDWRSALLACVGGAGLLALVSLAYERWRGRAGLGWGDVKMVGLLGAFLGLGGLLVAVFVASLAGAVVGLGQAAGVFAARLGRGRGWRHAQVATARYLTHTALPFGVFLAAGGVAAWRWGPWLLRAWLG